jgi:magnesium-transporting ATPase (P-type)
VFATSIAAGADYIQNKSFLGIREEINNAKVTVFRGPYGSQVQISVKELVVGDVI